MKRKRNFAVFQWFLILITLPSLFAARPYIPIAVPSYMVLVWLIMQRFNAFKFRLLYRQREDTGDLSEAQFNSLAIYQLLAIFVVYALSWYLLKEKLGLGYFS